MCPRHPAKKRRELMWKDEEIATFKCPSCDEIAQKVDECLYEPAARGHNERNRIVDIYECLCGNSFEVLRKKQIIVWSEHIYGMAPVCSRIKGGLRDGD